MLACLRIKLTFAERSDFNVLKAISKALATNFKTYSLLLKMMIYMSRSQARSLISQPAGSNL